MSRYVTNAVGAPRTLSRGEQEKILRVTGEHVAGFRDHMVISLVLGTALRESEVAALDVGDVCRGPHEMRSQIHLRTYAQKGRAAGKKGVAPAVRARAQRVFVPKLVRRKLQKYLAWKKRRGEPVGPTAPLFVTSKGKPERMALRSIRHMWRRWQARAGFDHFYTFHELRHTSLTNLYDVKKDLLMVQRQARHANVRSTQIYAHVSDEEMSRAVEKIPA